MRFYEVTATCVITSDEVGDDLSAREYVREVLMADPAVDRVEETEARELPSRMGD